MSSLHLSRPFPSSNPPPLLYCLGTGPAEWIYTKSAAEPGDSSRTRSEAQSDEERTKLLENLIIFHYHHCALNANTYINLSVSTITTKMRKQIDPQKIPATLAVLIWRVVPGDHMKPGRDVGVTIMFVHILLSPALRAFLTCSKYIPLGFMPRLSFLPSNAIGVALARDHGSGWQTYLSAIAEMGQGRPLGLADGTGLNRDLVKNMVGTTINTAETKGVPAPTFFVHRGPTARWAPFLSLFPGHVVCVRRLLTTGDVVIYADQPP